MSAALRKPVSCFSKLYICLFLFTLCCDNGFTFIVEKAYDKTNRALFRVLAGDTSLAFAWLKRYFSTQRPSQPVILVTGCSSGIGLALAQLLYRLPNYRVVVTSRWASLHLLRQEFKEDHRFLIWPLDVTSEAQRVEIIREIEEIWGGVDILINNAGVCYRSVVEHMDETDEYQQLASNYLGPMGLIRQVLPTMREKGWGRIINVSSVSGMLAMPTMASYSASKHALEGASEALWYECLPMGIGVTLLQPGFIRSRSFERVCYTRQAKAAEQGQMAYSDYYQSMAPFIAKMMSWSWVTPEKIAHQLMAVVEKKHPPLRVAATPEAMIFYYLRRFLPRRLFNPILFFCLPGSHRWGQNYAHAYTPAARSEPPDPMTQELWRQKALASDRVNP